MVPGEEDWRRVRDSAVLDVLQFIFLTDRKGRFTSTIKTVRCDLGIGGYDVFFIKSLDVISQLFFLQFLFVVVVVLFCSLQSVQEPLYDDIGVTLVQQVIIMFLLPCLKFLSST